jgi:hypothetical protein
MKINAHKPYAMHVCEQYLRIPDIMLGQGVAAMYVLLLTSFQYQPQIRIWAAKLTDILKVQRKVPVIFKFFSPPIVPAINLVCL